MVGGVEKPAPLLYWLEKMEYRLEQSTPPIARLKICQMDWGYFADKRQLKRSATNALHCLQEGAQRQMRLHLPPGGARRQMRCCIAAGTRPQAVDLWTALRLAFNQ